MNYGQLKKQSMRLVFSESIAGETISPGYNNQADYLSMIPGLANDCMMYIATTVKRIPELVPLNTLQKEDYQSHWLYTMPENFWRLQNGGPIWHRPDGDGGYIYERYHGYKLYANNRMMIPKNVPDLDQMIVEYYRYPNLLSDDPDDAVELDNTPDTHSAIPFYVGAHLVLYDDPFRYSALWNAFETRLGRITEPVTTEYAPIDNAYWAFNIPGV